MKLRTRWKRVYNPIIGIRFFDCGEYSLGYFTIEKLWYCKEYNKHSLTPSHSISFDRMMMKVRTDTGRVYKMPFCPWFKFSTGDKSLEDYYNENPYMYKKKIKN